MMVESVMHHRIIIHHFSSLFIIFHHFFIGFHHFSSLFIAFHHFFIVFHRFSSFSIGFHHFSSLFIIFHHFFIGFHRFSSLFIAFHHFFYSFSYFSIMFCGPCWSGGPVGLVGPWVWWAHGSGGFCWLLIAKSPTLRGPTCQGVLGLVFHGFPGTSIRPHYMRQLNGPSVSRFGIFTDISVSVAQIKKK